MNKSKERKAMELSAFIAARDRCIQNRDTMKKAVNDPGSRIELVSDNFILTPSITEAVSLKMIVFDFFTSERNYYQKKINELAEDKN